TVNKQQASNPVRNASDMKLEQQPQSAASPYTTLFRSRLPSRGGCQTSNREWGHGRRPHHLRPRSSCGTRLGLVRQSERQTSQTIDRKSTRLNSSHVEISYAVFCLKKKMYLITI